MAVLQSSFWTQKTAVLTHLLSPVGCEWGLGCFKANGQPCPFKLL